MQVPEVECLHGKQAYTDPKVGALDSYHVFCDCGKVVCLKIRWSDVRIGWCTCGKKARLTKRDYPELFV